MDNKLLKDKRILVALFVSIAITGFVLGTAFTYQVRQINARESFAQNNPVTVDVYKKVQDNSLVDGGWKYLGVIPDGRYHYQINTHNHIMNVGQNWMSSLITGKGGAGPGIVYIALGIGNTGGYTDASLTGGDLTSGGLIRAAAQATNMGAAVSGTVAWTLVNTFTCLTAVNNVDLAGVYTTLGSANQPTLFAETTFAAVNLASGVFSGHNVLETINTLTITWSFTSGGA